MEPAQGWKEHSITAERISISPVFPTGKYVHPAHLEVPASAAPAAAVTSTAGPNASYIS